VAPTRLRGTAALGRAPPIRSWKEHGIQEIPSTDAYNGIFTLLASRTDVAAMTGSVVTADSGLSVRGVARPGGRV
jgi:hypothetical protein